MSFLKGLVVNSILSVVYHGYFWLTFVIILFHKDHYASIVKLEYYLIFLVLALGHYLYLLILMIRHYYKSHYKIGVFYTIFLIASGFFLVVELYLFILLHAVSIHG